MIPMAHESVITMIMTVIVAMKTGKRNLPTSKTCLLSPQTGLICYALCRLCVQSFSIIFF